MSYLALPKLTNPRRHLVQERDTVDGNYHCTKSTKNSDPKDYLLYKGSGHFPTNGDLNDHLDKVAKDPAKKSEACIVPPNMLAVALTISDSRRPATT